MMNPVHIRLLNQQLYAPQFKDPAEVVAWMGAMQAQEYRLIRLAVMMRVKGAEATGTRGAEGETVSRPMYETYRNGGSQAFREAYDSGKIVRLHLLRCTWQLIAAEDHSWMVRLCSPKAIQAMNGWMTSNKIAISEYEASKIREILLETTAGKSVTKEDYIRALDRRGIVMDEHRLSYHIRMSELKGYLCSGLLDEKKATYSLVSEKIGKQEEIGREEALKKLARKYFQSHAPATFEDFVWWSGINSGDCKRAIELLGDEIHSEIFDKRDGREFFLLDSARKRGYKNGRVIFLPSYDEYLIGYKSRDLSLPAGFRERAHSNNGIFYPVIARDGIIIDNWKPFENR